MDYYGNFLCETDSFQSEISYVNCAESSNFYPSVLCDEFGRISEGSEHSGKQRYQANARERDRTQNVNSAFVMLRSLIPTEPKNRKLSKIEILRLAESYISHLANQLITGINDQPCLDGNKAPKVKNQVCTFCWSAMKKENK